MAGRSRIHSVLALALLLFVSGLAVANTQRSSRKGSSRGDASGKRAAEQLKARWAAEKAAVTARENIFQPEWPARLIPADSRAPKHARQSSEPSS